MRYFIDPIKKYAVFQGRASRTEFWGFFAWCVAMSVGLALIEVFAGIAPETDESILVVFFSLAITLPWISLTVRRLHDIGRSGYWYFLFIIPLVGVILMIVCCSLRGEEGDNSYGPPPTAQKDSNDRLSERYSPV